MLCKSCKNLLNLVTNAEEITETYEMNTGLTQFNTIGTPSLEETSTMDEYKTISNVVETTEIDHTTGSFAEVISTSRATTKSYQRIDVYLHAEILTNQFYDEDIISRSNTSLESNIEFEFKKLLESASLDRFSS